MNGRGGEGREEGEERGGDENEKSDPTAAKAKRDGPRDETEGKGKGWGHVHEREDENVREEGKERSALCSANSQRSLKEK